MRDVQNEPDTRNIPLQKVGVRNLSHPITVLDRERGTQNTLASVDLFASLPHNFKGTHMSRFVETFQTHAHDIQMPRFLMMVNDVRTRLDAERAFARVRFPYFVIKRAPVSGLSSPMSYDCSYHGWSDGSEGRFYVAITAPVTTLCPCSKEISDRGAHNQRARCTVTVECHEFFWIEEIIALIESCGSAGLYTLLKRADEKHVTEHAYDHPVFVEDLVRAVCVQLDERYAFPWYSVEASTEESIHAHDAYAYTERGRSEGHERWN